MCIIGVFFFLCTSLRAVALFGQEPVTYGNEHVHDIEDSGFGHVDLVSCWGQRQIRRYITSSREVKPYVALRKCPNERSGVPTAGYYMYIGVWWRRGIASGVKLNIHVFNHNIVKCWSGLLIEKIKLHTHDKTDNDLHYTCDMEVYWTLLRLIIWEI